MLLLLGASFSPPEGVTRENAAAAAPARDAPESPAVVPAIPGGISWFAEGASMVVVLHPHEGSGCGPSEFSMGVCFLQVGCESERHDSPLCVVIKFIVDS